MVAGVWSDDSNLQLEATTQFRKLLSIGIFFWVPFVLLKFAFLLAKIVSLLSNYNCYWQRGALL